MNFDTNKVDDAVLALLALTIHQEDEYGARAWKSHDWDALSRLHQKGLISDPASKAKSVGLTREGLAKSLKLFEALFGKAEQSGREESADASFAGEGLWPKTGVILHAA